MVRTGVWEFRAITCTIPDRLICVSGEDGHDTWLAVLYPRDREQEEVFEAMKNLIVIDEGDDFAERFWHEFVIGLSAHRAGKDPDPIRNSEGTLTFLNEAFAPFYGTLDSNEELVLTETCLPALKDLGMEMADLDRNGNPIRLSAADAIGAAAESEDVDREIDSLIARADRAFDNLFGGETPSFA
jgi:hypothetical protein